MNTPPLLPPERSIDDQLEQSAKSLTESCISFVKSHEGKDLTEAQSKYLLSLLDGPNGLSVFSNGLRAILAIALATSHIDSAPFWNLIDSIGFWVSAHPGVWPYSKEPEWQRDLKWSEELATSALKPPVH